MMCRSYWKKRARKILWHRLLHSCYIVADTPKVNLALKFKCSCTQSFLAFFQFCELCQTLLVFFTNVSTKSNFNTFAPQNMKSVPTKDQFIIIDEYNAPSN